MVVVPPAPPGAPPLPRLLTFLPDQSCSCRPCPPPLASAHHQNPCAAHRWVGYEETTWEHATMLDQPVHTYNLAPGLVV